MGNDASIDEFGTPADDEAGDDGPDDAGNDMIHDSGVDGEGSGDSDERARTGAESDRPTADDVTPTVTTYGWTPRNATCDACGESAKRRWRDDGAMVCRDCKEW